MSLLLVINPVAGGKEKSPFRRDAEQFCAHYGIPLEILETTGTDDRARIQQRVAAQACTRVMAAGGDGTLNLVVSALAHQDIPVGMIPLGSANGMAKELGVQLDPLDALRDLVLSQMIAPLDLLRVNQQHYCMHIGDVGLNAQVVDAFEHDQTRGLHTYAKYFVQKVRATQPFSFTITVDGESYQRQGVMAAICNARTFGTGLPINNLSNPFDGRFELVVVEEVRIESLVKAGLSTFIHALADDFDNEIFSCQQAVLQFDEPQLLQLDGEITGRFDRIEVELLRGAVPLVTHADNPYYPLPA